MLGFIPMPPTSRIGRRTKLWAAAFILVSLIMFLSAVFLIPRWHNWKPLHIPFDLSAGNKISGTFTADVSTIFALNLAVRPELEKTRLHCLLGMELPIEDCKGVREVIQIEWFVSEGGKEIAKGDSSPRTGSYWSDVTARSIGYFEAVANRTYSVTAISRTDGGDLRSLKPQLIVETSPGDYEGFIYLAWLVLYAAVIPLIIGLEILAIGRKRGVGS